MPSRSNIGKTNQPLMVRRSARLQKHDKAPESQKQITIQPSSLRRSPRFLHHRNIAEPLQSTTPRRPQEMKPYNSKSRKNQVCSPEPSLSSVKDPALRNTHKSLAQNISERSTESYNRSQNRRGERRGLRKCSSMSKVVCGIGNLGQSPRLSNQNVPDKLRDTQEMLTKKSSKSDIDRGVEARLSFGVMRKSARLNNSSEDVPCLRRSQRLLNRESFVREQDEKSGTLRSPMEANSVALRESRKEENLCEQFVGRCRKDTCVVFEVESGNSGAKSEDKQNEGIGIDRKRKRGEIKGWTKEQEIALQRAYFAAKPTPHFWKKVSRLVPGKSAQDCFDKVHSDHLTPSQPHCRSRAKRINSSPLGQFSLSASKLLKSTEKKVKRSSFLKQKSCLAKKSMRKLLRRQCKVHQDHEADLFSVLEPDMDLSIDAFQHGGLVSTPIQQHENQGLLQKSSEGSSYSHSKSLSRLSRTFKADHASPRVLKQVKNWMLHEKYLDQLHSRESKRRAAFECVGRSKLGENDGEKGLIQKNVVRAAKLALVSEARDAISKFQYSQANFNFDINCYDDDGFVVERDDNEGEEEESE